MAAVPESDLPESLRGKPVPPSDSPFQVPPEVQKQRDAESIRTLQREYLQAAQRLQDNPNDVNAREDVKALTRELAAKGGQIPTGGQLPPEPPAAPPAAAPAASSPMAEAAKQALGEASAQTGISPGGLAGGALGGALGVLEQRNLVRPVTMMGNALSAAQEAMRPPVAPPAAPVGGPAGPVGPLSEGLTSGEKWAAKTGYGTGAGTVQDVSSRYQRSAGRGPVSSAMSKTWGVPQAGESPQLAQRLIDRANAAELLRNAPKPSGLDQVTQMFRTMAEGSPRAMSAVGAVAKSLPIASYPLAGYSIGSDVEDIQRQLAGKSPDYADIVLKGLGALGTGMSLHPATAPVGIPLAVGSPMVAAARRKIMAEPTPPEPTYEELVQATRPSFRMPRP